MTNRIWFTAIALLFVTGCSSTHTIHHDGESGYKYSDLNRKARGKVAEVTLRDGRKFTMLNVQVAADSTSWIDPGKNAFQHVATADIAGISIIRSGKGALAGLVAGAVSGLAAGAIRASMEGADPNPEASLTLLTKKEKMAIYPVAHAVSVSLFTVPVGAMIGRKDRFVLSEPSTAQASAK